MRTAVSVEIDVAFQQFVDSVLQIGEHDIGDCLAVFRGQRVSQGEVRQLAQVGPLQITTQAANGGLAVAVFAGANVIDFGKLVMDQDARACELNQAGLHAEPFQQGVLMPEEYILKWFHDWVRRGLEAQELKGTG